jgi:hypothetical protein
VGFAVRRGLSLPIRCPNVPLDERLKALPFLVAAAHRVRVDPPRERWVGMPKLLHHVGRVLADRHEDRGERVAQLVGRDPKTDPARPASRPPSPQATPAHPGAARRVHRRDARRRTARDSPRAARIVRRLPPPPSRTLRSRSRSRRRGRLAGRPGSSDGGTGQWQDPAARQAPGTRAERPGARAAPARSRNIVARRATARVEVLRILRTTPGTPLRRAKLVRDDCRLPRTRRLCHPSHHGARPRCGDARPVTPRFAAAAPRGR